MVNPFGKPGLRGFRFALFCLVLTARVCGEAPEGQTAQRFPDLLVELRGTASLGLALASASVGDKCAICSQCPRVLPLHTRAGVAWHSQRWLCVLRAGLLSHTPPESAGVYADGSLF